MKNQKKTAANERDKSAKKAIYHGDEAEHIYACIDLKSFYASVECRERGLDPLITNLVVADETRTDKTICLAVSPALKDFGVPGRPRLFEVKEIVKSINFKREREYRKFNREIDKRNQEYEEKPSREANSKKQKYNRGGHKFNNRVGHNFSHLHGKSIFTPELEQNPSLALDFLIARPRMRLYMKYSTDIYRVYLEFISSEDILVYSIDEVFIDLTDYIKLYHKTAEELVAQIIATVFARTGITATAGIGTNMYLAKVAMDITAKHMQPNETGARIATLDEKSYREKLWTHQPLTDFWRVGRGYQRKLHAHGIRTMGDVARVSLYDEDLLFRLFGVNAEFLIDHAWGYEPCTLKQAKNYRPTSHSLTEGQVLPGPYDVKRARLVLQEMTDEIALGMVKKHLVSSQFVLMIGYSKGGQTRGHDTRGSASNVDNNTKNRNAKISPASTLHRYAWARGTVNIPHRTSSTRTIMREIVKLYDELVDKNLLIRKLTLVANNVVDENTPPEPNREQLDLFGEFKRRLAAEEAAIASEKSERNMQRAVLEIKQRYGKNAILRAIDFEDGATARKRNGEVGGHRE